MTKPPVLSNQDIAVFLHADRIATIHAVHARQAAESTADPVERERLTHEADAGCAVMHGIRTLTGAPRLPVFMDDHGRPIVTYLGLVLHWQEVEILRGVLASHADAPVVARVLAALAGDEVAS
jgi:hypothetical protein